ncbi:MAG: hypothetical protein Q9187_004527 [Circinaria calcarea]
MDSSGDAPAVELDITSSLEDLQTNEQRLVLDTIAQIRKCGLESILSLPQLVVCGDQSAGKSSVLEALTEIPFPRNDNLCTRFATEIILRRATTNSLTIRVIPDTERNSQEQESIKAFKESITNLDELPGLMDKAMVLMGIDNSSTPSANSHAFAKDVLSIEIEGPLRPQLTVVDLPGLIQTESKGVTKADVELVAEITDHYISQPRTICLAVVSAANDYANQGILTKVRKVDPKGERTLGIITKPDRLPSGSGMETAFLNLARNQDIFFKLGWHVLKNRSFEEGSMTFSERNDSEANYFRKSTFKILPKYYVGIESLRGRLSQLLFCHVKLELPKLREDLDAALVGYKGQLGEMGDCRATPQECKSYLSQLSLDYYEVCKAAAQGYYEGDYFNSVTDKVFSPTSPASVRRLRAVVQFMNTEFSNNLRTNGHKYHFEMSEKPEWISSPPIVESGKPTKLSNSQALQWVNQALMRTRGKELAGNFNPLLIGELFWEQSFRWYQIAADHMERVSQIQDTLKIRKDASIRELELIMEDVKSYPINYNHYYTDTIKKRRQARGRKSLAETIEGRSCTGEEFSDDDHTSSIIGVAQAAEEYRQRVDPDMEKHSCEEALDCLFSIYKVCQKTFVQNITTQVIERHIVRGIEKIFSPVAIANLSDVESEAIASEPASAKRHREFLKDRIGKLEDGHKILRNLVTSATL